MENQPVGEQIVEQQKNEQPIEVDSVKPMGESALHRDRLAGNIDDNGEIRVVEK